MTFTARRNAPYSVRIAAIALAAALPVSALALNLSGSAIPVAAAAEARPAVINAPFATKADAEKDGYITTNKAGWRQFIYQDDGSRFNRMEELKVYSPSMDRDIPIVTIRAEKDPANAPTIYLLNGADGGTGRANWLQQTSAIDFYGKKIGNVNVVIPMDGAFSYYTDWQQESVLDKDASGKGGKQMWETFLTAELPGAMEQGHFKTSNPQRAIVGMSMSASSVLVYAENHPGLYSSIASYSGCPATTGMAAAGVDIVLDRGKSTYEQMWGDRTGEVAMRNDAFVNVAKMRDQQNVYISAGTGLMGEHDMPSGDRLLGNPIGSLTPAVEGGPIEAATNVCTQMFRAATENVGMTPERNNIVYNFRTTGTHQWGYWQDDMFQSWPVLARGLGFDVAEAQGIANDAAAEYLASHQGVGTAGSTPAIEAALAAANQEQ